MHKQIIGNGEYSEIEKIKVITEKYLALGRDYFTRRRFYQLHQNQLEAQMKKIQVPMPSIAILG